MTTKLLNSPSPLGDGDGNKNVSSRFSLKQRRITVDWEFSSIEKKYATHTSMQDPIGTVGLFVPSQRIELVVDLFPFSYIGRSYPYSEYYDGIDFSAFGAYKLGVSRQHAVLVKLDEHLLLLDNHSTNGTYLNLTRLDPHQPYIVRDNDIVRLGAFEVVIKIDQ